MCSWPVFRTVDPTIEAELLVSDGAEVDPGDVVATLWGSASGLLVGERVALNFLQRMSGIATATRRYVAAVEDLPVRIVETRKTTPGLRILEKYAVRVGGGHNHRHNLSDAILIKDNHLAALEARGIGLAAALDLARQRAPHTITIEVEVETPEKAAEAAEAGRGHHYARQYVPGAKCGAPWAWWTAGPSSRLPAACGWRRCERLARPVSTSSPWGP